MDPLLFVLFLRTPGPAGRSGHSLLLLRPPPSRWPAVARALRTGDPSAPQRHHCVRAARKKLPGGPAASSSAAEGRLREDLVVGKRGGPAGGSEGSRCTGPSQVKALSSVIVGPQKRSVDLMPPSITFYRDLLSFTLQVGVVLLVTAGFSAALFRQPSSGGTRTSPAAASCPAAGVKRRIWASYCRLAVAGSRLSERQRSESDASD